MAHGETEAEEDKGAFCTRCPPPTEPITSVWESW